MTENDDLGQVAGTEPDLDTDLFDEEGWDEDFESDGAAAPRTSRASGRRQAASGEAAAPPPAVAAARAPRRAGRLDHRIMLVAAGGLIVSLPATLGVLAAVRTSPGALVGLTPESTGISFAFLLGVVATVALAVGAGVALAAWTRRASQRHEADQALLAAVSALDLEDPRGWQAPLLVGDANLAALTERLLGTYRLQQAKLTRYVCLEGELHRLGKSLACAAREDLEGQWDNVAVGTAADEALRIVDKLAATDEQLAVARKQIADCGPDLVAQLAEARGWSTGAIEQVNAQGAAIERVLVKLGRLGEAPSADETRNKARQEQIIAAIRQDLAEIPTRSARPNAEASPADLTRLVDRASKLAFQIAMEVARLAGKNERLLPMTQDLEELTTELRAAVAAAGDSDAPDRTSRLLENIRGRVAELAASIAERHEDPSRNAQAVAGELTPATRQVATALQQVSRGIGGQVQRLDQLLQLAATLTGIEVPSTATAEPVVEPGNSLFVDRFDPFSSGRSGEAPNIVADPFANSRSVFNPEPIDSEFCQTVLPGNEDVIEARPAATIAPVVETGSVEAPPAPLPFDDVFAEPTPPAEPVERQAPPVSAAPAVSAAPEERIYDLGEFDAVRLEEEQDEERIFDLVEFDAVLIA